MRRKWLPVVAVALALLAALAHLRPGLIARLQQQGSGPPPMTPAEYERWAQAEFARRHPGEKPVNWAIAEAARRFYQTKPMGKFVLSLTSLKYGNDCSDFTDCAVDEGLGVGARFKRKSPWHLLAGDPRVLADFCWQPGMVVQPGDVVCVDHSPWYEPYPGACRHVGVVGPEGMVYDFVKLRRWPEARYGCHSFEWFIQNSHGARQVIISRVAAKYRYKIETLPRPVPHYSG